MLQSGMLETQLVGVPWHVNLLGLAAIVVVVFATGDDVVADYVEVVCLVEVVVVVDEKLVGASDVVVVADLVTIEVGGSADIPPSLKGSLSLTHGELQDIPNPCD